MVVYILFYYLPVHGQDDLTNIQLPGSMISSDQDKWIVVDHTIDMVSLPSDIKLISVASLDGYSHKTFMVDQEGEAISSGYMPSSYFRPNNNFIILTGKPHIRRDSFNPYGADDLPSLIFFGTVNNFLGRIKINRR